MAGVGVTEVYDDVIMGDGVGVVVCTVKQAKHMHHLHKAINTASYI